MNLIKETIYKSNRTILDADVSSQMIAILHKGIGEGIVTVNGGDVFTVSVHASMIRILDDAFVIYDGQTLQFFTQEGICTQEVEVGRHLFDLLPMKDAVACTYRDQGVYGHEMGEQKIVVVHKDGTVTSHLSFADEHSLDFDIPFARVKPFACLSMKTNSIVHFTADFQLQNKVPCPIHLREFIAMSYQYPHYFFAEEDKLIWLHEDGTCNEMKNTFSFHLRSSYHRGPYVFLEIVEQEVIGYLFTENE